MPVRRVAHRNKNTAHPGAGMSLIELHTERDSNPVDVVERLASLHDWSFDRAGDDEIAISVRGRWTDYHVSFTWMDDIEALHLACAFDLKVPEPRRSEVLALIALINEQLWVGHFDMWTKDGIVMFRHALLLAGGGEVAGRQCEALLDAALDTSERYFQAFQFVVWAGKSARESLDAAMFETAGEAEQTPRPGLSISSCPAEAGQPVSSERRFVVTGSPACAGDDD